jgi:cobalamin biosynthetic protein CobC
LRGADLAIVVNPNNPDGRLLTRKHLENVAAWLAPRGLLVVDEAFMDVGPPAALGAPEASVVGEVGRRNIVVLRSFGKFFGLAGVRLGFAIAPPALAERLRAALGPWAVSGPAIAIGTVALADRPWIEGMRRRRARAAQRLDAMLEQAGFTVVGGTSLFRLAQAQRAPEVFEQLGRAGILARRFAHEPTWLRFGIPGGEPEWERLEAALVNRMSFDP